MFSKSLRLNRYSTKGKILNFSELLATIGLIDMECHAEIEKLLTSNIYIFKIFSVSSRDIGTSLAISPPLLQGRLQLSLSFFY